jgi:predicted nicotinamide N-methyase
MAATGGAATARLAELRTASQAIGPLAEAAVTLPGSGRILQVLMPTDLDGLLDRAESDPEQNLPYWAEVWPSGLALAGAILRRPELVAGRRVLEIGSGLGVTAAAALLAGADLVAADYSPESLLLCRYNARRNAGREPETFRVNWRAPDLTLLDPAGGGYPVVLAADVLYEGRDVAPLLGLVERLVAPGGLLWLAEPGRPPARRFLEAAGAAGWAGVSERHEGPWPDPADAGVVVGVHRLGRRGGDTALKCRAEPHPEGTRSLRD